MAEFKHFYEAFQPEHYVLKIDVNRATKLIQGTSTITGHASVPQIAIHQKDMTIASVLADGDEVAFTVDNDAEAIRVDLPQVGDVTLEIAYTAPLTDTMMGIYPSYYKINGERKELIGTQFETTAARQAFPSIDEPEAKATFDLWVKFDEQPGETILANMPEIDQIDGYHVFDTTVRMSTYLIAFAFGEMHGVRTETNSGVQVGVFGTKAHPAKELEFALDIAKRSIEFFEDYYQTPYPLPHSWQLALPDFSAGAMENWGLITYREAALLVDPDNSTLDWKRYVASVITHEVSHQWFGDLVTMKWWDDLWLNESFANMMMYLSLDGMEPSWHIWETFQTGEVNSSLNRDSTDGVQPVHVQVEDPAEIDALFDGAIVYAKGSRLLVMVRDLIGDDALRAGLKSYFAKHQYGNATGADLWAALGEASGMDIGAIMTPWLEQPGYPVVEAAVVDGQLTLIQKQFFQGEGQDKGRLWPIPLNGNYKVLPDIMSERQLVLGDYEQLRAEAGEPLRLNVGNASHFIVNYDPTLLADLLGEALSFDAISQLQILQDLRLLAEARQIDYDRVVPLLETFSESPSNIVNNALYNLAAQLKKFTTPGSDAEKNLKALYRQLSAVNVKRLGWAARLGESDDDQLTRPIVLEAALYGEDADVIMDAHALFVSHQADLSTLPASIRALVLKAEVEHHGSQELFEQLLAEYQETSVADYKGDLRVAIGATKDPLIAATIVDYFETSEVIKPQDLRGWFLSLLTNPVGEQLAWDWMRNDWNWLEKTVGGDMEFATYVKVAARAFKTEQRLQEFKAFFEPKLNEPGLTREITMDIRVIETKVNLVNAEAAAVNAAVKKLLD